MKNIATLQKNYAISKQNISTVFDIRKISLTFTSTRDNDELTKYSDSFFFFFLFSEKDIENHRPYNLESS